MKLIPIEERGKYRCHFCGTNKSVKYVIKIFDPVIDDKPVKVTCCNKCALLMAQVEAFRLNHDLAKYTPVEIIIVED